MRAEALFKLHARSRCEFAQNGERARLERYLARVCPDMTAAARQRVTRQIARGLDVFGRDVINDAIDDVESFEIRLNATRFRANGYPDSLAQSVLNAVRYLHVAARDGDARDLRRVLYRKRPARHRCGDLPPFSITPADLTDARQRYSLADQAATSPLAPAQQNNKDRGAAAAHLSASLTLADVEPLIAQLARLLRKAGAWDADRAHRVIGMLLDTLSDRAVIELLAAVPEGHRRPVAPPSGRPVQPTVADLARDALRDVLIDRCGHDPAG